jgi:hypothetical protein
MGADFVYAIVEVTEPENYWQDWLGELNDDEVMAYVRETDDRHDWIDLYDYHDELGKPAFCQKVVERVSEAVKVCYDYQQNREMGWHHDGDRIFIMSGGMSWGDPPTECLDDMWMFDNLRYWRNNKEDK